MGDLRKANEAIAAKRVGVRYDKKTLARYTGYSVSWIEKKIKEGLPVAVPGRSGVACKIDLGQMIGWLIENERAKAEAKYADQIRRLRIALAKEKKNKIIVGGMDISRNDVTGETASQNRQGDNDYGTARNNGSDIDAGNTGKRLTQDEGDVGIRFGNTEGETKNAESKNDTDNAGVKIPQNNSISEYGRGTVKQQASGLAGGRLNTGGMIDLFEDHEDDMVVEGEDESKRRLSAAKAAMAEIELAKRQGRVVDIDLVCSLLDRVISASRARLLAIPRNTAQLVIAAEDINAAYTIIDKEICEALDELSRLDPADFVAA